MSNGWTGRVSPVMRQKSKGVRPLRNKMRALARRFVVPGYPVTPRAMSLQEVRDYFSGDKIVCLRCGRPFRRLAGHLQAIHQMTEDDYRALYGLPWRRGLTSTTAHESYKSSTKARWDAGEIAIVPGEALPQAARAPKRPRQPFHKEISAERARAMPIPGPKYGEQVFAEILRRVRLGRIVREVVSDPDMPGSTWLRKYMAMHASAHDEMMAAIDTLSFYDQARNHMGMGPRFYKAIAELRAGGLSDKRIAAALGVTTMTVHHHRRAMEAQSQPLPPAPE